VTRESFIALVGNAMCALVIGSLWLQHRRRSPGLELWTVGFALQTVSVLLIAQRGPSWMYGYKLGLRFEPETKRRVEEFSRDGERFLVVLS